MLCNLYIATCVDSRVQRKKVVQGGGGPGGDGDSKSLKEADEKMKRLRKRNADLVGLAKTLEERCKSLKLDNDKLVSVVEYKIEYFVKMMSCVMTSRRF